MWSSFEAICNIGEKCDPTKYYTFKSALNAYKAQILDSNSNLTSQELQIGWDENYIFFLQTN